MNTNEKPSSNIALFTFPVTGQTVRTVIHEGKPWFVARDVALVLGYIKPRNAISVYCKHAKILKGPDLGRLTNSPRGINIIPESDVFRLVMRSRLPQAEAFQDWVCEEVLPAIRRTGRYQAPTASQPPVPVPQPTAPLNAILDRLISIEQQITPLKDKARRYDAFLSVDGTCTLTQAAKIFNMTGIGLGRLLRSDSFKWLFKRGERNADANLPTKEVIALGYMVVKPVRLSTTGTLHVQARFTPVGLDALRQKLEDLRRELLPLPDGASEFVGGTVIDCATISPRQ